MILTWLNSCGKATLLQPLLCLIKLMLYIGQAVGQWRYFIMKSVFEKFQSRFGEGTAFDLDYGKLIILMLLIYLAFFKDYGG